MNPAELEALVAPVAAEQLLEIDRLDVVKAGKRRIIRVFLDGDGPDGRGPSLDQIAETTRGVFAALDSADVTNGHPYTLEVSSRGVNRPLTEEKHFRRNLDRLVKFDLAERSVIGRIRGVSEDAVEADVDDVRVSLALAEIRQALVQVELNRWVADAEHEQEEG